MQDPFELIKNLYGMEIEQPTESMQDLAREGQAALYFLENRGKDFKSKQCKQCKLEFAYCWDVDSIAYCSISCIKKSLQEIGIDWVPTKPAGERWGQTIPAVVPPDALLLLQELIATNDTQEFPPSEISA